MTLPGCIPPLADEPSQAPELDLDAGEPNFLDVPLRLRELYPALQTHVDVSEQRMTRSQRKKQQYEREEHEGEVKRQRIAYLRRITLEREHTALVEPQIIED